MTETILTISSQAGLGHLPTELHLELFTYMSEEDLHSMALTSTKYFSSVNLVLRMRGESWETNALKSFKECEDYLDGILMNPSRGRHVYRLILKPSHSHNGSRTMHEEALQREHRLGHKLIHVLPHLTSLYTFFWDGIDSLDELIWTTLRRCCPKILYVGASFGVDIPEDSALFTFNNLLGFRIHPESNPLDSKPQSFPKSMWDMILNRCPGLLNLAIGKPTLFQYFDISPLAQAKCAKLRSLSLCNATMESVMTNNDARDARENRLANFLSIHYNSLQTLSLGVDCQFYMGDMQLQPVIPLKCFIGDFQQFISSLKSCIFNNLEELRLSVYVKHEIKERLRPALRSLTFVKQLSLALYHSSRVKHKLFRQILSDCPQLEHVTFSSNTCNFRMRDIPRALFDKPAKLKSIEVEKKDNGTEWQGMTKTAVNVLLQCPGINKIVLRYTGSDGFHNNQREGRFSVERTSAGAPKSLKVTKIIMTEDGISRTVQRSNYPISESFGKYDRSPINADPSDSNIGVPNVSKSARRHVMLENTFNIIVKYIAALT